MTRESCAYPAEHRGEVALTAHLPVLQTRLVGAANGDRPRGRNQCLLIAGKLRAEHRAALDGTAQHLTDLSEIVLYTQGAAGAVTIAGAGPRAVAGWESWVTQAGLITVAVRGASAPHGATGRTGGVTTAGNSQGKA
jgi:hypothetical protein